MSSSNRQGGVCDAVLVHGDHAVGPIRLPLSRPDDFIDHFNRVYGGHGLSLTPKIDSKEDEVVDGSAQEKIPGDSEVTGDDSLCRRWLDRRWLRELTLLQRTNERYSRSLMP